MCEVWFWQLIISPHMAGLATALQQQGCDVTYVAQLPMSSDRAQQGWSVPSMLGVTVQLVDHADAVRTLAQSASADSIHVCQGIRANGQVGLAQRALAARGLRQWVVMETINDRVWFGALKRLVYRYLLRFKQPNLEGILATGHETPSWLAARSMPVGHIYPFAYFLSAPSMVLNVTDRVPGEFRFIFVGQLVARKRVDWLIQALASLSSRYELWIVGSGPDESALRRLAAHLIPGRVRWFGQLPIGEVGAVMEQADCLVLPSVHDGWGAVASEAMMVGTPVVCSDTCGVAGVVIASGMGGVFPVVDAASFAATLECQLMSGTINKEARKQLSAWAECLGATAGARYLQEIFLNQTSNHRARPAAPWLKGQ